MVLRLRQRRSGGRRREQRQRLVFPADLRQRVRPQPCGAMVVVSRVDVGDTIEIGNGRLPVVQRDGGERATVERIRGMGSRRDGAVEALAGAGVLLVLEQQFA